MVLVVIVVAYLLLVLLSITGAPVYHGLLLVLVSITAPPVYHGLLLGPEYVALAQLLVVGLGVVHPPIMALLG